MCICVSQDTVAVVPLLDELATLLLDAPNPTEGKEELRADEDAEEEFVVVVVVVGGGGVVSTVVWPNRERRYVCRRSILRMWSLSASRRSWSAETFVCCVIFCP